MTTASTGRRKTVFRGRRRDLDRAVTSSAPVGSGAGDAHSNVPAQRLKFLSSAAEGSAVFGVDAGSCPRRRRHSVSAGAPPAVPGHRRWTMGPRPPDEHVFEADWKTGSFGFKPELELNWRPPPEPGSGKFVTPWARMHLANFNACASCAACCAGVGGVIPITERQALNAAWKRELAGSRSDPDPRLTEIAIPPAADGSGKSAMPCARMQSAKPSPLWGYFAIVVFACGDVDEEPIDATPGTDGPFVQAASSVPAAITEIATAARRRSVWRNSAATCRQKDARIKESLPPR